MTTIFGAAAAIVTIAINHAMQRKKFLTALFCRQMQGFVQSDFVSRPQCWRTANNQALIEAILAAVRFGRRREAA
jgi:hypothetical protein